jgi:glutamate synthase domain-containing protein 2
MVPITVNEYVRIPPQRRPEFWSRARIEYIRALASSGRAVSPKFPSESNRILDRVRLKKGGRRPEKVETRCRLAYGRLELSAPLYLGDMSFGALSGVPNVALARAADLTGVLCGTGEGGLHEEVAHCRRIAVQWASARFGVDLRVLRRGMAVVIKIGQGAKPGIGGHLPGVKVTEPISRARRIPVGVDAISPAPHHDIYSIEDLEQRIRALQLATGRPVFVKVGATNYIPYIASGVARMGAEGIIIDGHGAGTGAAPQVVRDNVGLPVELAVASVDRMLRREGLREGFTIIAGGQVGSAEDTVKLLALGADAVSIGTAALIAMGCVMVHRCHLGFCPALLTNRIDPAYPKIISLEHSVRRVANLIRGWSEEVRLLMEELGVSKVEELVGRRDLLYGEGLHQETLQILGTDGEPAPDTLSLTGELWDLRRAEWLKALAGTMGRTPGEPYIASMGSTAPPFIEEPRRVADWIRCDGAQVTRPSIDPYREEVETAFHLFGGIRVAFPVAFRVDNGIPSWLKRAMVQAAKALGLLALVPDPRGIDEAARYASRMLVDYRVGGGYGGYVVPYGASTDFEDRLDRCPGRPRLALLGADEHSIEVASALAGLVDGLVVDEDVFYERPLPLEVVVSEIDYGLKRAGLRYGCWLIAAGKNIRGSDDIYKLLGLGADLVALNKAALVAIGYYDGQQLKPSKALERLECFLLGVKRELQLLAGAAGLSNLQATLVGNRELFRTVDLAPSVRRRLHLEPAGRP